MDKFSDIRSLIFEGFLKETLKFRDFVVIIRTLTVTEENIVIEQYKDLPQEYNLMTAVDTIKYAIYSVNGTRIDNNSRQLIKDWPKQIVVRIFRRYLKLVKRVHIAYDLINEFVKTDDSRMHWSTMKISKTSLNSAVITGNQEFESAGLTFLQQLWIYLNEQEDKVNQNKLDWARVEYMTDSICTFINPKAMRQVQGQKQVYEEQMKIEEQEQIKQIQKKTKEKIMIENTADDLFAALKKTDYESPVERHQKIDKLLVKAFEEDEHDKIIREYEEYEFCKQLRIKKENARRAKILYQKKLSQATVIDVPVSVTKKLPNGIIVGLEQVSTMGNDTETDLRVAELNKGNLYYVNGVDYSDVLQVVSFTLLKNRDILFKQITGESDDETIKWINVYIEEEKGQTETVQKIKDIIHNSTGESSRDKLLDARERILSGNAKSFDDRRKKMLEKMNQNSNEDEDEISFIGGKNAR